MTFVLRVYRGIPGKQYWEEFELPITPSMNLIAALMQIRKNPINRRGERTTPVVWEDGCLEEVCGSCSMLVDGWPRQACSAIVEPLLTASGKREIALAPFTKFPLVRDLVVDRSSMFEALKKVRAWVDVDNYCDQGPGPTISPEVAEVRYILSTCMTCGCCTEACPQMNSHSPFIGPAPISQVRLFNAHPTGAMQSSQRLVPLMEKGGVNECGNAQNCARVCPKKIPLTESIGVMERQAVRESLRTLFGQPDA
jgi:succinate dehydrogenase / fumarate reductase, iron-sulfur subunit